MKAHDLERFQTLRRALDWARSMVIEQAEVLHEAKGHSRARPNADVTDLTWRNCHTLRCENVRRLVEAIEEAPR